MCSNLRFRTGIEWNNLGRKVSNLRRRARTILLGMSLIDPVNTQ